MLSKIRQRSWEVGQSLAGDGMLLRLRNASIALVGAVAAVGLGLTLFISQLGFPTVFSGPIPGNPAKAGSVRNAIALTHSPALTPSSSAPGSRSRTAVPANRHHAGRPGHGSGSERGGPDQIAVSPGTRKSPAAQQPVHSVPVPPPATPAVKPSPPAPSPAPAPAVVESQPTPDAAGQPTGVSAGGSKPSTPSTAKATSDENGKSTGPLTSKSGGQTVSAAKPTSPSEKAGKDQSAAASPGPAAPPASAPAGGSNPAAAKEAADSGK